MRGIAAASDPSEGLLSCGQVRADCQTDQYVAALEQVETNTAGVNMAAVTIVSATVARWFTRSAGLLLAACAVAFPTAASAEFPEKPIRLIVPQAPGSATDVIARLLAAELGPQLGGATIVVDNRPGGALTLGIDLTAKSPPDGYTLGMGPIGALAITRHMVAKLPYDIERDLQPIALISRGHLLLAAAPTMPFGTVKELVEYAKKNPGKLMNASSSNGSPGHVGGELFKYMTGTEILHIPYKGGAQAINDLLAGHVHLMFESLNSISSTAKGGRVKALGVSGPRRSPAFPDLPTIAEAGVTGYDAGTWSGVIAPAGVPRPIVEKLNAAINRAISTPAFKERFGAIGDEPAGGTPEEFAETIRKDSAKWADVVKRSGAKLD
jgi:tripartite-type tricarboxylate transporter receptor subunit TctC